jgi:hypothetical protein
MITPNNQARSPMMSRPRHLMENAANAIRILHGAMADFRRDASGDLDGAHTVYASVIPMPNNDMDFLGYSASGLAKRITRPCLPRSSFLPARTKTRPTHSGPGLGLQNRTPSLPVCPIGACAGPEAIVGKGMYLRRPTGPAAGIQVRHISVAMAR